jgi:hypothetical protein
MSMTVPFDTLRFVDKLKSAGVSEAHAKAESEALTVALAEAAAGNLATKDDVTTIKIEMAEIKSEMKLMKWMLVTIVAGIASLMIKTFF